MESEKAEESGKKKRWAVEEKARAVRRYLKDHVGLADLAEETGTSPGLILQWAKQALEGLEQTFFASYEVLKESVSGPSRLALSVPGSWP